MYQSNQALKKIMSLRKRIRAVQGGTWAGKTIGIILYLIHLAQTDEKPTLTSIVSESFPHLKRGAMRDFLEIMNVHHYFRESAWNKTDYVYTFETKSKIEFFSADQPGKIRGPRRDRLFINEANNISFETFDQLEIRTRDFIYLDWNPVSEFWFYDEVLNKRKDVEHIILTYKDNEVLNPEIVKMIEERKGKKGWWRVYGEGLLGEAEEKIYSGWEIIDEIPEEAELIRYGLDFGFENDPTAIIGIYKYNQGFILDEICYLKGLLNKEIADIFKGLPKALIYADPSEPKSIQEIKTYGLPILGAAKGQGSVNQGINFIKGLKISITKRSVNLLKEYRNYFWKTDKDGKVLNEPIDIFNHTMDAIRYGFSSYFLQYREKNEEEIIRPIISTFT